MRAEILAARQLEMIHCTTLFPMTPDASRYPERRLARTRARFPELAAMSARKHRRCRRACCLMLIDQASKLWLLQVFDLAERQPYRLGSMLDLVLAWNRGISYSLLWAEGDGAAGCLSPRRWSRRHCSASGSGACVSPSQGWRSGS